MKGKDGRAKDERRNRRVLFVPVGIKQRNAKEEPPVFEVLSSSELSMLATASVSVLASWDEGLVDGQAEVQTGLFSHRRRLLRDAWLAREAYQVTAGLRRSGRGTSRRLLEQSRVMLAGAAITHRREDFDAAEKSARDAVASAADDVQRCRALTHLAEALLKRAESEPDLMNWELAHAALKPAAKASVELGNPRSSQRHSRELGREAVVRCLRLEAATMMAELQVNWQKQSYQKIRERLDLAEDLFSGGRSLTLWPGSSTHWVRRNRFERLVRLEVDLLRSRLEYKLALENDDVDALTRSVQQSHAALEGLMRMSDLQGIGEASVVLATQLATVLAYQDSLGNDDIVDTATNLVSVIATGLTHCLPGTRSHLRLLDLAAQMTLVTRAPDPDTKWLCDWVWKTACAAAPEGDPATLLDLSTHWAMGADAHEDRKSSAEAYRIALRTRRRLTDGQVMLGHKEVWLTQGADVHGCAANALAQIDYMEEAVLAVEQGRSVLYSSVVAHPEEELETLSRAGHTELAGAFLDADRHYRGLADDFEQSRRENRRLLSYRDIEQQTQQLRHAARQRDRMLVAIRQVEGCAAFPRTGAGMEDVRRAARESPIAYIAPGLSEGSLLMVRPDGTLTHRSLPLLTAGELKENGTTYLHAYRDRLDHRSDGDSSWQAWGKALYDVTEWLWRAVMGPVIEELDGAGHVRITPTGLLAVLPMWAAWHWRDGRRRWALEHVACSYIPNAALLLRQQARGPAQRHLKALIIDSPQPSTGYDPLEYGGEELAQLRVTADERTELRGQKASLDAVRAHLPTHSLVHFNAHGYADEARPRKSGIVLAQDQVLTVEELRRTDCTDVMLMVLSSCESGLAGGRALDEMISMPGAVYSSARCSVISSLWATEQVVTAELFRRFYQHLEGRLDGHNAAMALRQAQMEVLEEHKHPALWAPFYVMG
ncbi:CHAT domain-containing protein [Streptomyces sp. NPDC101171]|uniref:CHAT domain-containing protein n=1 Tax=Streptomyces sp. NPDC101171 TaxID=3366122 RepID=UPI0037F1C2CB